MPIFSVITVTRNNRNGLAETTQSLLSQNCKDYEHLIIDGDSTDGTKDDFPRYAHARIFSEPDSGIYDAMNKGIDAAKGHYLLFLNAGDCLANANVLTELLPSTLNGTDFIYGDSYEGGRLKPARHASQILFGMFTHHQAMIYRREAIPSLRYDTHYKIAADYDFTVKFLKEIKSSAYCSVPICIFEQGGVSQTNAKRGRDEQYLIRRENNLCSVPVNHVIRFLHALLWGLRTRLPTIYRLWKRLQSSCGTDTAAGQNKTPHARPESRL